MHDNELIKIAAFKLRESAMRMMTLAREAQSQRVRVELMSLHRQLIRHGSLVLGLVETTSAESSDLREMETQSEPTVGRKEVAGRAR